MFELKDYEILNGNALDMLKTLPDCSVQTCITSPPYYGLRDYGTGHWVGGDPNCKHQHDAKRQTFHQDYVDTKEEGKKEFYKDVCPLCGAVRVDEQIGLEETPEDYIKRLVEVFHEVKRVLKDDGTLWVNIGDSYAGGAGRWGGTNNMSEMQANNKGSVSEIGVSKKWQHPTIKQKDLIGIPWMLAFALRADGWYLRQDIIWHKPNPMPESVTDRCTKSHEYIFLLSKNSDYYFDHESMMEDAITNEKRLPGVVRDRLFQYDSKRNNNPEAYMLDSNKPHSSDYKYVDSKYASAEQESSVRQGMNKDRGNGVVELRNNLPDKEMFLEFIRKTNADEVCATGVNKTTYEHWLRKDDYFSFPTVDDWNLCRELLNDNSEEFKLIDKGLLDVTYESDDINKNFTGKRNRRDVWTINVNSYKGAHFATYPEKLVEPCVLAGTKPGDVVLDIFNGSGTTGAVAMNNGRKYIGIELNPDYVDLTIDRFDKLEGIDKIVKICDNGTEEIIKVKKTSLF